LSELCYKKAGVGFFWKDLFVQRPVFLAGTAYYSPAPFVAMLFLIYDSLVWYLLAWYFNNVLGEGALPWNFLFTKQLTHFTVKMCVFCFYLCIFVQILGH
jgi:hypothetical protein